MMLFLLRPGRVAEYCDQSVCLSVCVCLCICLSTSISLEPLDQSSEIFCADPMWPWLGSPLAALQYVMYFCLAIVSRMAGVAIPGRSLMSMNALFCMQLLENRNCRS